MTAAKCKVLRDGKQIVIEQRELVPGDVVLLEAGDAVPADGRLLESASLKIEEAALTGESVPVNKAVGLFSAATCAPWRPEEHVLHGLHRGIRPRQGRGHLYRHGYRDGQDRRRAGRRQEGSRRPLQRKLESAEQLLTKMVLGICVFIFVFDLMVAGSSLPSPY